MDEAVNQLGPWQVGRIAASAHIVSDSASCGTVLDMLLAEPDLPGVPVFQDETLVGLAGRECLLRNFANPLYQALFQKRPIRLLMSAEPLVVQASDDVDFVTHEIAARKPEALQEGFVILSEGCILGVGSAHKLMDLSAAKARHRADEFDGARRDAERASEAKSTFLAGMSHELRTPLNAIIGFSEMLQLGIAGKLEERQRDCVGDIHRSAVLLLDLINDVLDLSSIEANKIVLRDEIVDLGALADECIRTLKPRWVLKRQEVLCDRGAMATCVRGDQRRIRQVMLNLLTNAVKYTPDHGRVWVTVDLDGEGRPGFVVTDNGIGIAAEHLEHVLSPFGRAVSAYTRDVEGTGIGLALARRLSEHHGGTLGLESTLGLGTAVTVRFPKDRLVPDHRTSAA